MTSETQAGTSIWFKLAQMARLLFWLVLTGVVVRQVFGQRDTTQKARAQVAGFIFFGQRKFCRGYY